MGADAAADIPCHSFFDWTTLAIVGTVIAGIVGMMYFVVSCVKQRDRVIKLQADLEKMSNGEEKEDLKREMKRMVRAFNELVGIYDNIDGAFWLYRRTVWEVYSFLMTEGTSLLCRPDIRSFQLSTNRLRWKANILRREYEQILGPPLSAEISKIGFGTHIRDNTQCRAAVKIALEAGYRHFDCALACDNQQAVGEAIKEAIAKGIVKREELFITSKVWNTFHSYEIALKNVEMILDALKLEYLDLCLMHWPFGDVKWPNGIRNSPFLRENLIWNKVNYLETWRALEKCVEVGKIRWIGLSNFTLQQAEQVIANCEIKPAVLEVELHPFFQQRELIEFCRENAVEIIACSPLGTPPKDIPSSKSNLPTVFIDPVITDIAKAHQKSNAQVVLRFLVQRYGACVIPKSVNEVHIRENLATFEEAQFVLSGDELEQMEKLDLGPSGRRIHIVDYSYCLLKVPPLI